MAGGAFPHGGHRMGEVVGGKPGKVREFLTWPILSWPVQFRL